MKNTLLPLAIALSFTAINAIAGGTYGGTPPAEFLAQAQGKCTQYKLAVKTAKKEGKAASTVAVPVGCKSVADK